MIGPGYPGQPMEAFAEGFACGQVGIITITIDDGDGNNVVPQTTNGILQIECGDDGFAVYRYLGVFPSFSALSPYVITWEGASATDPGIDTTATEEIFVSDQPIAPPSNLGPCTDWITGDDVMECCGVEASAGTIFDDVAVQAQNVLYQLSGKKFSGLCGPITVRPCRDNCSCFPAQRLAYASGGSRLIWTGSFWGAGADSRNCGCGCLSRVLLSGYPVQLVTEVKIDGVALMGDQFRLDENRYLTRVDGSFWPSCQDLALEDTEEGTFSVSYGYGANPPAEGQAAAAQLACELYKACNGDSTCALPTGVTRISRQGIVIEKASFTAWSFDRLKGWQTGLSLVDAFLNAHNPYGMRRRPIFWGPGRRYARPVG